MKRIPSWCISMLLFRFSSEYLLIIFKSFVDRLRTKLFSLKLLLENFVDRFQNSYQSKNWLV